MRWFTGFLALCLVLATGGVRAEEGVQFSDSVMPIEKLFYVMWKPLWQDLQNRTLKRYSAMAAPNGDTDYYDQNGQLAGTIRPSSIVNVDGTRRITVFDLNFTGGMNFVITVTELGEALTPFALETVRSGRLPFFPTEPSIRNSEVAIASSGFKIWFEISRERRGESLFTFVQGYSLATGQLLTYREESSPGFREFTYRYMPDRSGWEFTARKFKTPEMRIGSEEFIVDSLPISLERFQMYFEMSVLLMAQAFISFN